MMIKLVIERARRAQCLTDETGLKMHDDRRAGTRSFDSQLYSLITNGRNSVSTFQLSALASIVPTKWSSWV